MSAIKKNNFVGGRIIKTGISVLITAFICHLLNWPAMFAVITAIVTIEPTASDSIRKAFVRFPASAIGAAFAVLFTFLFGDSPYSYALVSLLTIIACHKLKFQDGMLVATLTGVAMISTVHEYYVSSFFIRLGTTTTGLVVSSLVNIFLLPPNYVNTIKSDIQNITQKAGSILCKRGQELVNGHTESHQLRQDFQELVKVIDKTETHFTYQKEEWKFHRFKRKEVRKLHYEYKKFITLRQVVNHIGNLIYLPSHHFSLNEEKSELILCCIQSLKSLLCEGNCISKENHQKEIQKITEWFTSQKEIIDHVTSNTHQHILPETAIMYELLSISDLIDELNLIQNREWRSMENLGIRTGSDVS